VLLHQRENGEHWKEEEEAMKMLLISLLFLAGCTNAPQTAETKPKPEPLKKTYTAEEMQKTGRTTVGGQLQEVDPSVTVSHGGR
jgi:starvation-inducible outer membrane lipoprotein